MTTPTSQPILITGGTGKIGRRVADRLAARDIPIRVGSRDGTPPFDWDDRTTWPTALDGSSAVFLSFAPDLAVPGAAETVAAFAEQAVARGARRLVLLSGRGEAEAERAERLVRDAGGDSTVVRCSFFAQNFSEGAWRDEVLGGEVVLPVGAVREPFVDADDVADVTVAALTEDGHAGALYELTGPRLLTFAEAVGEIAEASGREVRFAPTTIEQYQATLAAYEVPEEVAALLIYLFGEVLDGRNASVADGVERALGRPARDFRAYAQRAAAGGAWAGAMR